MRSKFGALLAAFALLFVVWSSPSAAQTGSYELANTRWNGSASFDGGVILPLNNVQFRSDGVVVYTDDLGTWENGRWRQRELLVTFEMNDYFVHFTGLEDDGNTITGHVYNMRGERGTWRLTRAR